MKQEQVNILAIESSCDETAAAVVANGREVRSNVITTQIPVHRIYGGVVPEIASRHHLEAISPVVQQALADANCSYEDIHAIAVANGPGLVGSLLVGVSYAKALAFALGKPLIAVHHWQGHLAAIHIEHEIKKPFLALVVSGSHSGLLLTGESGSRFLGMSHDDAAGEAFDKIARALGLPYPGGPEISRAAESGLPDYVEFPRAWLPGTDDFSFSGLKSAVLNYLNQRRMKGDAPTEQEICSIARAAQEAICDVLSAKAVAAAQREGVKSIALVGGVAANRRLRELLGERAEAAGIRLCYPSPVYCTDNAAMIGVAAYEKWLAQDWAGWDLNADPRLLIG
ncbi:MAG: tRNA (adenosine(37)-N6)-threonylcarbamoyltransferase complex transferase subunit TsaD [Bacillota bacterium]|nr:tRNA (adenosine(37)-N6)-threonylcarbamoyltransferase complex transferase subunit TsaD [Bacillota bacterium]